MNDHTIKGFQRYGSWQPSRTGILLVDPYNDFIHPEGKSYYKSKEVIEGVRLLDHMRTIITTARELTIQILYVPHHRAEPTDYTGWKYITATQLGSRDRQVFGKGTWGGEFHDDFQPQDNDIIIKEHWSQSGFANTDLDMQLKQHNIDRVILIGMLANTCLESTGRYAMELGYHVTLVTDASAAYNWEYMHAAHEINGPTFAHAILNTEELTGILRGKPVPTKNAKSISND
ncbi:MAG TPA: isochorismatase family cysteine hydrolase [Chitinophagaceae bacterium]|nr:isochorismatase family cysteine hydrolase [Chitinophagaceae bacterium]